MQPHYIKEWRKHRGLTQLDLAQKLDMSRPYLSMIERGERRYDQWFLEKAAEVLETTPANLIARAPGGRESIDAMLDHLDEAERLRVEAAVRALVGSPATDREM